MYKEKREFAAFLHQAIKDYSHAVAKISKVRKTWLFFDRSDNLFQKAIRDILVKYRVTDGVCHYSCSKPVPKKLLWYMIQRHTISSAHWFKPPWNVIFRTKDHYRKSIIECLQYRLNILKKEYHDLLIELNHI